MGGSEWISADFDSETAWLSSGGRGGAATGFDPDGWEASIWIGHAIYELRGVGAERTHDDVHRSRLAAGAVEPLIIGNLDLEEVSTVTGGGLGYAATPASPWVRLPWADLAERLNVRLQGHVHPPSFSWFPYKSWPASMEPPTEGSLDEASLHSLIGHLHQASPVPECVAAYGFLAAGARDDVENCFRGPISRLDQLVDSAAGRIGTPSNVWATDRAWLVYTDWDLWATKVSGSLTLIDQLAADPNLDTLNWPD